MIFGTLNLMEDFSLEVDGLKLHGKFFCDSNKETKHPAILFIHGWESKQDRYFGLAQELADAGYACMTFDLRGHGMSEGDHKIYSRKVFLQDVLAAYDFLIAKDAVDSSKIIVLGSSFGSYLAALLCAERSVHSLALRVPADYLDDGFDEPLYEYRTKPEHANWKEKLHSDQETASLRAIHEFKGNVLIIESEKDETVPAPTVRSYKNAVGDSSLLEYVVMHDAPHSISHYPEFQKEYAKIIFGWLKQLSTTPQTGKAAE